MEQTITLTVQEHIKLVEAANVILGLVPLDDTHDFQDGNGPVKAHKHPNGGGWVADTTTVHTTAYVGENAWVFGNAQVSGDAWVFGDAWVCGNAWVFGNARVSGDAQVSGDAWVSGDAQVFGNARVSGDAQVSGDAWVSRGFLDSCIRSNPSPRSV